MTKLLVICMVALAWNQRPAWSAPTGSLRLTLEKALPTGRGNVDLEIDLRCEDGRFLGHGLAFSPSWPAIEHAVQVEKAEFSGDDLALSVCVLLAQRPATARYTVDLRPQGDSWRGNYRGEIKGDKDKPVVAVQSLTRVAADRLPIVARADWLVGPEPVWPASAPRLVQPAVPCEGVWDCRFAEHWARAGQKALAEKDAGTAFVAARAIRRFLLSGLGETGASNGQPEFAAALPTIRQFVAAYWQTQGVDLGAGTGLRAPPSALAVVEDRRMGTYLMRQGDFMTSFTAGGVVPARRGHFTLTGLGREWVRESSNHFNVVHVHPAQVTRLSSAFPQEKGHIQRVCVFRDGSGSVAMVGQGFVDEAGNAVEKIGFPYEPKSWRTIGVDYSGVSGAAAVLVFVEGHTGLGDRRQAWEADLGDLSPEEVVIEGAVFTVKPTGSKATMRGTVLYPGTAHIDYLAPANGRGGRIRLWRTKPEKAADVQLEASLDRKVEEISLAFNKQIEANPENELKLALDLELEDKTPKPELAAALERQHLGYFAKMFKHTTSTSMGGPNRAPQARASWVVVLTMQEGPAPVVQPLPFEDPALLKVGEQTVGHQEYLIEFGRKR